MRKKIIAIIIILFNMVNFAVAQCALCTKTAQGLDPESGSRMNNAIIYLAVIPFSMLLAVLYYIFRMYKRER